jgi:hypothetical protein
LENKFGVFVLGVGGINSEDQMAKFSSRGTLLFTFFELKNQKPKSTIFGFSFGQFFFAKR